jgi:hypothetical protein
MMEASWIVVASVLENEMTGGYASLRVAWSHTLGRWWVLIPTLLIQLWPGPGHGHRQQAWR